VVLNSDDLPFFVAFVLLDEACRSRSGKRQTAPLSGMWLSHQGATGMRLSDRRLRWAVCIEALRNVGGLSVDKAAATVAALQAQGMAKQVNVIRVAYYEYRRLHALSWDAFYEQFLHWRAWVFESEEETFQVALGTCPPHLRGLAQCSLAEWIARLKADPQQILRNRNWLLEPGEPARSRIESNYWDDEINWAAACHGLLDPGTLTRRNCRLRRSTNFAQPSSRGLENKRTNLTSCPTGGCPFVRSRAGATTPRQLKAFNRPLGQSERAGGRDVWNLGGKIYELSSTAVRIRQYSKLY